MVLALLHDPNGCYDGSYEAVSVAGRYSAGTNLSYDVDRRTLVTLPAF